MDVSGFMIDLDGTIYKGGKVIPGAVEFIDALKTKKIPFVFLTNNSSYGRDHYVKKLNGMGFNISKENVLSSTTATLNYIRKNLPGKSVFPLGTEQFIEEVKGTDITITDKDPDIVLLAFDKTIDYAKMNDAYHHILNGAAFIATHPDDLCPTEDGYDLDIGPYIRFFESMTGKKATIIGKPNRLMVEMAASEMNVDPKKLCMIGDRLYTDMRMAVNADIASILVLSGETKRSDLDNSDIRPTYLFDTVFDIIPEL